MTSNFNDFKYHSKLLYNFSQFQTKLSVVYSDLDTSSPIPKPSMGLLAQLFSPITCRLCPQARTVPPLCRVRSSGSGSSRPQDCSLPLSSCIPSREDEAADAHLPLNDGTALLEDTQCSGSPAHMVFCPRTTRAAVAPSSL